MPDKNDQFANLAILTVTESAANTLTFKKLETGISLSEKVAWIINKIEYTAASVLAANFNGDGDSLSFGLAVSNSFTAADIREQLIIDWNAIIRRDFGTAASMEPQMWPAVKDFSSMPSGGILVPPVPLYIFAAGSGLVSATNVYARIYYTLLKLSIDQYWELVESRRVISS